MHGARRQCSHRLPPLASQGLKRSRELPRLPTILVILGADIVATKGLNYHLTRPGAPHRRSVPPPAATSLVHLLAYLST